MTIVNDNFRLPNEDDKRNDRRRKWHNQNDRWRSRMKVTDKHVWWNVRWIWPVRMSRKMTGSNRRIKMTADKDRSTSLIKKSDEDDWLKWQISMSDKSVDTFFLHIRSMESPIYLAAEEPVSPYIPGSWRASLPHIPGSWRASLPHIPGSWRASLPPGSWRAL